MEKPQIKQILSVKSAPFEERQYVWDNKHRFPRKDVLS